MGRAVTAADDKTFVLAARVRSALDARGVDSAVIGAMALAVHGFPRATGDFDLATATDPFTVLRDVARELAAEGLEVELRELSCAPGRVVDAAQ